MIKVAWNFTSLLYTCLPWLRSSVPPHQVCVRALKARDCWSRVYCLLLFLEHICSVTFFVCLSDSLFLLKQLPSPWFRLLNIKIAGNTTPPYFPLCIAELCQNEHKNSSHTEGTALLPSVPAFTVPLHFSSLPPSSLHFLPSHPFSFLFFSCFPLVNTLTFFMWM